MSLQLQESSQVSSQDDSLAAGGAVASKTPTSIACVQQQQQQQQKKKKSSLDASEIAVVDMPDMSQQLLQTVEKISSPSKLDSSSADASKQSCEVSPETDRDKLAPVMYSLPLQTSNRSYISRVKVAPGRAPNLALYTRRPFSVPKFPNKDPTSFDPNSTDHSVEDSPVRPRKRKVVETEAEADNLDDLIASLKRVAERDMKPNVFEKIKKKASNRNIPVESLLVEKLSLLNIPKRSEIDDDDLESLGSVDTDMAPASETSRDLECTYSDLESINESISSKGDVLSTTRGHTPVPDQEGARYFNKSSMDIDDFFRSETNVKIFSGNGKTKKGGSGIDKNVNQFDILPLEKLEAMIAELDQVISDTDSCDEESSDTLDKNKETDTSDRVSESGDNSAKETNSYHFTMQEVHVNDEVEFSKASSSVEMAQQPSVFDGPNSVCVSSVTSAKCSMTTDKASDKMHCTTATTASNSASTSISFIPSSEQCFPVLEKATLVTLISRPTSEESLASRKVSSTVTKEKEKSCVSKAIICFEVSPVFFESHSHCCNNI